MPIRSIFIVLTALVGVAYAWLQAGAQQAGKVYRVGFLTSGPYRPRTHLLVEASFTCP
jgi:hypothetical protein